MTDILMPFEHRILESITRTFAYLLDNYSNREIVDWATHIEL